MTKIKPGTIALNQCHFQSQGTERSRTQTLLLIAQEYWNYFSTTTTTTTTRRLGVKTIFCLSVLLYKQFFFFSVLFLLLDRYSLNIVDDVKWICNIVEYAAAAADAKSSKLTSLSQSFFLSFFSLSIHLFLTLSHFLSLSLVLLAGKHGIAKRRSFLVEAQRKGVCERFWCGCEIRSHPISLTRSENVQRTDVKIAHHAISLSLSLLFPLNLW